MIHLAMVQSVSVTYYTLHVTMYDVYMSIWCDVYMSVVYVTCHCLFDNIWNFAFMVQEFQTIDNKQ